MKIFPVTCLGLLLLGGVSCARFASPLPATAQADPASAILYGRLTLRHTFSAGMKIALWLQNADSQKSIYVCFDEAQSLPAILVKPGRYRVVGFLATNRGHQIKARRAFPDGPATRPFTAGPGSQTYLGDFTAHATLDGQIIESWGVDSLADNFAATTVEFRETHPRLMTAPAGSIFERSSPAGSRDFSPAMTAPLQPFR